MAVRPDQPETARQIERLVGEAQRIQAYETAASSWDRSEGRAEEAWLRVLRANAQARETHWNQTTAAKRRWDALSPRLALELKEAQTQLSQGGGLGYREAKALRGALYHRDLALRQARNGDLDDAADNAEEALGLVGVVDKGYAALHSRFEDPRARRQWTSWVAETIEQSRQTGGVAILVDKLARKLEVYDGGKRIATYVAELGANGLKQNVSAEAVNVFDWMKANTAVKPHERVIPRFDLIVLDPPSFTRNRASVGDALRGYKEIHIRALKLLKVGGALATFCCSHHVDAATFQDVILSAAYDTRRILRRVATYSQSPDHPVIPMIPETEYLKGFAFEVVR